MRGRIYTVAVMVVVGAAWSHAMAAESGVAPGGIASAELASNSNAGFDRDSAPSVGAASLGADGFALFPSRFEWGFANTSYAVDADRTRVTGHYARIPALGSPTIMALGNDSVVLRDLYVAAEVAPGLMLNFANWNSPRDAEVWDSRIAGAFENPILAASGMRSPYFGLSGSGVYAGASISLSDSFTLHFGRASASLEAIPDLTVALPRDVALRLATGTNTIETNTVGLEWNVADWAGVAVHGSQTHEAGSVLGATMGGSLLPSTNAETAALGISARVGFGEGWVTTVAYNEGVTQLDIGGNGFGAVDSLRTRTYGIAVAKQGLFGNDFLGFSVSRPIQTYGGAGFAGGPISSLIGQPALPQAAPITDFQVGYVTSFLDGALALQANAGYQLNANGEQGQDAVTVLSRAKIKF